MDGSEVVSGPTAPHSDIRAIETCSPIDLYLIEKVPEFKELTRLRKKGWENPDGDKYFQRQRRNADRGDEKNAQYFFTMMQRIAEQLHAWTGAFRVSNVDSSQMTILDFCMAPGGFLKIAMDLNPGCSARAFSLPASDGGHRTIHQHLDVEQDLLDITMLAADMGVTQIPEDHPDAQNFLPTRFAPGELFDLVLCDGQVLRTHARAEYRERREARRLAATQIALGLEHVRAGGTMILLLHKLELCSTVSLIRDFTRFSTVKLFKPTAGHATRSSFYMVASGIQSTQAEAISLVKRWKSLWNVATFGTEEEYMAASDQTDQSQEKLLETFGDALTTLGRPIWSVQAGALARAPYTNS